MYEEIVIKGQIPLTLQKFDWVNKEIKQTKLYKSNPIQENHYFINQVNIVHKVWSLYTCTRSDGITCTDKILPGFYIRTALSKFQFSEYLDCSSNPATLPSGQWRWDTDCPSPPPHTGGLYDVCQTSSQWHCHLMSLLERPLERGTQRTKVRYRNQSKWGQFNLLTPKADVYIKLIYDFYRWKVVLRTKTIPSKQKINRNMCLDYVIKICTCTSIDDQVPVDKKFVIAEVQ